MIDLTDGKRTYDVSTTVVRNGERYMGPTVRVTARDENHAKEVAAKAGHQSNPYFPPVTTTKGS